MHLFRKFLYLIVVLGLLLEPVASGSLPPPNAAARAQPQLVQLAVENRDQLVAVIVQQSDPGADLERKVERLGGKVTQDLHIINAFAAELPAQAALELAQDPAVRWVSLNAAMLSTSASKNRVFVTWADAIGSVVSSNFVDAGNIIAEAGVGPDDLWGYRRGNGQGSFTGFEPEIAPDYAIVKVELVVLAYVNDAFSKKFVVKTYQNGSKTGQVISRTSIFHNVVGPANADLVAIDITGTNQWNWADFGPGLEIVIEQSGFGSKNAIYYDAIGLRVTSAPGLDTTEPALPANLPKESININQLATTFPAAVRAPEVWNEAPAYLQGQGITVAVVDSGIGKNKDLDNKVVKNINFNSSYHDSKDKYGHGSIIAGLIAGNGNQSNGRYIGIAPKAKLLNVRISDDQGMASESDVVAALQWILDNATKYGIRVVNLSLNSSLPQSYHTSPLCAAVEILWFNGITVVVSAGNHGSGSLTPPANDPFVITVGAVNDKGTADILDDEIPAFSGYGVTEVGTVKPELVAPGKDLVAYLPKNHKLTMVKSHPDNRVTNNYFRVSGTSFSTPIVTGAVALLLQDEPGLTPDQVKHRLMATANKNWTGYDPTKAGDGILDVYAAVHGTTTDSANTNLSASQLLWTGTEPVTWSSVAWNSVAWNSVAWNSVAWNSVAWNSVAWNSDYWGD